ncbi:MAG: hypothetical protein ACI88H_000488 [Cocleimonas sp.]|jgi:hypothetical protein
MKHWTEPNGILLIHIPIDWQYLNPVIKGEEEVSPYSFQPYAGSIGCFQLSCYPLEELLPKVANANPKGVKKLDWRESNLNDSEFCTRLYHGALGDQALIGKYIHDARLKNDVRIKEQFKIVRTILNTVVIVPKTDRKLAADLDKFDRFTASLAASHDLLSSAIESESYIEIIAISANQIDAYLRLSVVITKQVSSKTNDFDVKFFSQAEGEWGIMERKIYEHATEVGVIDDKISDELNALYQLRNRVIHRYIISNIKTRDLVEIATRYLKAVESVRLILAKIENMQAKEEYGVYGKMLSKKPMTYTSAIQKLYADANDKHLLKKFKREIGR